MITEEPDGLLGELGRWVGVLIISECAEGEWVGKVFDLITARIEDSTAVIIAEGFDRAGGGKGVDYIQHSVEDGIEFMRNVEAAFVRQAAGMEKKIKGIYVIVEGLLEVDAIGTDLADGFLQNDPPAFSLPDI